MRRRSSRRSMSHRRRRRPRRRMRRTRRVTLDPERKFMDNLGENVAVHTLGFIILLNDIQGGSTLRERIGIQQINMSSFLTINMRIGAAAVPVTLKFWLVFDNQPNGALLTLGTLLQADLSPTVSPRNLFESLRLKVLWSRKYQVDPFNQNRKFSIVKSMRKKTRWNGAAAGIANLRSGALYLVAVSDILAANNPPEIDFYHRLRFVG